MNLQEIRDLFIKRCGRYDLITESGQDDGANFFIQSGSRFLDRRSDIEHVREGVHVGSIDTDGLLNLHDCWMVKRVLSRTADSTATLTKVVSDRMATVRSYNRGFPAYYTIRTTRYAPTLKNLPAALAIAPASSFAYQDMVSNSLLLEVLPHPTRPLPVEVHGCFYSASLVNDQDTNTWSERYPDTLVKAALYQLEIFYRNTEGANDWLNSIQLDLTDAEQLEILADIQDKDTFGL